METKAKSPTSAVTLNRASSINPAKDQKMNEAIHITDIASAPEPTRRKFLAIAAAGSAATLPAVALAGASEKTSRLTQSPDPLIAAIIAYRDGFDAYNCLPDFDHSEEEEDAAIEETYGAPMRVLENWSDAAATRNGASEALRLATEENGFYERSQVAIAMIGAALLWLESGDA